MPNRLPLQVRFEPIDDADFAVPQPKTSKNQSAEEKQPKKTGLGKTAVTCAHESGKRLKAMRKAIGAVLCRRSKVPKTDAQNAAILLHCVPKPMNKEVNVSNCQKLRGFDLYSGSIKVSEHERIIHSPL